MRNDLYDIEKGFLIILVVIGHSVNTNSIIHNLIFSFHMPVFFMITGLLSHWNCEHKEFLVKRIRAYVVPYFSWCLLLFLVFWIENPMKYIVRIIYGGAMNTTHYTYPFWFICCLFVSSVIFNYLWNLRKWVLVILICYLFLWYTYLYDKSIPCLPWSLEVAPFVIMYFFTGFYISRIEEFAVDRWGRRLYIVPVAIAIYLVITHISGYSMFTITMKTMKFGCLPLDIIYPLTFYLAIKGICIIVNNIETVKKVFLLIGKASLVIMFTHASIFNICKQLSFTDYSQVVDAPPSFIVIEIMVAIMFGSGIFSLFTRNRSLAFLFLGKYNYK